jgi:hypothetical protein
LGTFNAQLSINWKEDDEEEDEDDSKRKGRRQNEESGNAVDTGDGER